MDYHVVLGASAMKSEGLLSHANYLRLDAICPVAASAQFPQKSEDGPTKMITAQ